MQECNNASETGLLTAACILYHGIPSKLHCLLHQKLYKDLTCEQEVHPYIGRNTADVPANAETRGPYVAIASVRAYEQQSKVDHDCIIVVS